MVTRFVEDVERMSGGAIDIEMYYSAAVVKSAETFDAAANGILDRDMTNNVGLGIYDIAKHTTFPGFHSMSSDQLAWNSTKWETVPDAHKAIIETAMQELALQLMMRPIVENGEAKAKLPEKGVTIYNWSEEDRATFRAAAQKAWDDWATPPPETKAMGESHKAFIKRIGLGG